MNDVICVNELTHPTASRIARRVLCALLFACASATGAADAPLGLQQDVVFDTYSPLSRSFEMMRRLMSPLRSAQLERALAQAGRTPSEQAIDLAQEKFAVYVPEQMPHAGYGVLVFIPPWDDARVPAQWIGALERHGIIFVAAAKSGNDANVLDRREPLALLAADNIVKRYHVDTARVYVGGFSGGSRVALRIALAYPDFFRGALLDAGSDPIGSADLPLPTPELFHEFQDSRIVFLTGKNDVDNLEKDSHSRHSLDEFCVFNLNTITLPFSGHQSADAAGFERALTAIAEPAKTDATKLASCRASIEKNLATDIDEIEAKISHGQTDAARDALNKLDERYGALALPRSIALGQELGER